LSAIFVEIVVNIIALLAKSIVAIMTIAVHELPFATRAQMRFVSIATFLFAKNGQTVTL
jgi:hypothetical protein